MRILNIICDLNAANGGPAEGAQRLAEIWRTNGHIVHFATLESPEADTTNGSSDGVVKLGRATSPNTELRPASFPKRYAYSHSYVPWLRAQISQYDAVLVHSLWNYSTLAARRVLVGSKVPYFVFPHGCLDPWFRQAYPRKHLLKQLMWRVSEGVLLNNASSVLFTTEEEQMLASNAFLPYQIRSSVVGFGATDPVGDHKTQVEAFRAAHPALGTRRYLLFLSRIHSKKGCDLLIDAFANIARAHESLDLVMAGPDQVGLRRTLELRASELGIASRIHWTGMICGDLKWGAFRGADAFILPSHSENFGVVVAEALACSTIVLITDKVNVWPYIAAEGAGLVEPDTSEGVQRLLARFLAMSEDDRMAMRATARRCYQANFTWEGVGERIFQLISQTRRSKVVNKLA